MKYRSKFEGAVHATVPQASYETIKIKFKQPSKDRTYTPDLILPSGIIVETKGRLTAADRQKMIWVRDQHPELDIRFCFQRSSNPISKGSKTTYAAWAEKHGFLWCEKTIPTEWVGVVR